MFYIKKINCATVDFLALLDFVSRAAVVAQASVRRPSVVRKFIFSETAVWIQAKFYG